MYSRHLMRNLGFISICLICLITFIILPGCSGTSQPDSGKTWDLRLYSNLTATDPIAGCTNRFIEEVGKQTNNRVNITPYWSGALASFAEAIPGLKSGIVDIGAFYPPSAPGSFPVSDVVSIPFLVDSMAEAYDVLTALYADGLMAEFEGKGFHMGYFMPNPMQHITVKDKLINKMEDMNGLKVRAPSGPPTDLLTILKAVPTSTDPAEVYMGIDRGVIDGTITSPNYIVPMKYYEVAKSFLDNGIYCSIFFSAVNQSLWDSFPSDIQKAMDKCLEQWATDWLETQDAETTKSKDLMKQNGVQFTKLSNDELARWQQATLSIKNQWVEKINKQGLPGQQIIDKALKIAQ